MRGLKKSLYIVINGFRRKLYLNFLIKDMPLLLLEIALSNMLFKIKFLVKYQTKMFLIRHSFNLNIVEAYIVG